jgi:hypothetical protein
MIYSENDFKDKGYVLVKKFLPKEFCDFAYDYCKMKALVALKLKNSQNILYKKSIHGTFDDPQARGCFSIYSDTFMETLLSRSLPKIELITGLNLLPAYSYWRLYQNGSKLKDHTDRESCEISGTLCIGYDSHYSWPMYVGDTPLETEPGDLIMYRGSQLNHYRHTFEGKYHAQTFLHYVDKYGKYAKEYNRDSRPFLGMPSNTKTMR